MTDESPKTKPERARKSVLQFRIAHLMVLPILLVAALIWLDSRGLLPTYTWSDRRTMALEFEVVDGVSGQPLEGVLIQVVAPGGQFTDLEKRG
jgi:hypothetical protein